MKRLVLMLLLVAIAVQADDYVAARQDMVDEIRIFAKLAHDPETVRFSDAVMDAMNAVERHRMVPKSQQRFAYENRPWRDIYKEYGE